MMKLAPNKGLIALVCSAVICAAAAAARAHDLAEMAAPAAYAGELGELRAADIAKATLSVPAPPPASVPAGDPVVVTVPGLKFAEIGWGPLEPRIFTKLVQVLFPRRKGTEAIGADEVLREAFKEYNAQFDDRDIAAIFRTRLPGDKSSSFDSDDTYLDDALVKKTAAARFKIVPFIWSRDPGDTEATVQLFVQKLARVHDSNPGRPVCILSHSWGGVIMHDVLHRLAQTRPDIKIQKFVTLGSPLVPGNAILSIFKRIEISKQDLERVVRKPSNVLYWQNVWSSRDPFSNEIAGADENFQDDKDVASDLEARLRERILHGTGLRMQAKTDLITIMNVRLWHKSYYEDYEAYLRTIDTRVSVKVFEPRIVTPLAAR